METSALVAIREYLELFLVVLTIVNAIGNRDSR